jgi:hypothetical protein
MDMDKSLISWLLLVLSLCLFSSLKVSAWPITSDMVKRTDEISVTSKPDKQKEHLSASDLRFVMAQRFVDLHEMYLSRDDAKYTSMLRATLRHARRLEPTQCVVFQRQLIEIGNAIGYDGIEPVWLVYQDCTAAGDDKSLGPERQKNAQLLKQGLRFAREPLPQLSLRITYWNSTIERGLRGDAMRVLLKQFTLAQPAMAQRWGIHQLLNQPEISTALCGLPIRVDQFGKTALPELVRRAGCLTDAGANPKDICNKLFPQSSLNGTSPSNSSPFPQGISDEEKNRLESFCNGLTGTGAAGTAGIDDLDAYSSDQCTSEDSTRLYETAKIIDLMMNCYFPDQGSPLAEGATSANYDRILNRIVEWQRDRNHYAASLMTGRSHDDPGRNFYSAEGSTPQQARDNLLDQLANNPPNGYSISKNPDGSVTIETEYDQENPDGTTSRVRDTKTYGTDGSTTGNRIVENKDGSGHGGTSSTTSDGTSVSIQLEWDADGKVTKKTETTTDKDGKTTTTTTEFEYDEEGNVKNTKTSTATSTPSEPGGFDPHNPACQELMALDVMPGGGRSKFWNDLFNRPYKSDPRTVHPAPDQEADWSKEPFCGAPGIGSNNARAKCSTPVMCAPDTYLDNSCTCQQQTGGAIALKGCATATCPEGTTPVPVGANACTCQTAEGGAPGLAPPPGPRPDVTRAFSEFIWNRSGGKIFITDEMARRHNTVLETSPR